jgi:S-DNA-T family DNA segregation ATPase FtsK/SpoIIIE
VATIQRSRPSRASGAKAKTTKKSTARAGATPAKAGSAKAANQAPSPALGPVGDAFSGHGRDVAGVALAVVGAVAALGLYADLAGPVGRGLATALLVAFGVLAYVLPVVLVGSGVLLVRRRPAEPTSLLRPVVGGALLVVAGAGLLHLATGGPGLTAPTEDLEASGGYLGAVVTAPLSGLLGVWASALVLVALATVGLIVAINRPLHEVGAFVAGVLRPAGSLIARGWRALFTLGESAPEGVEEADAPAPVISGVSVSVPGADDAPVDEVETDAVAATDEAEVDDLTPTWLRPAGAPTVVVPTPAAVHDEPATSDEEPDEEIPAGPPEQLTIDLGPAVAAKPWKLPKPALLDRSDRQEVDATAVEARGRILERALAEHGVETRLVGMVVGPTVTRFELELGPGVKVARVTSLNRDIAYAMASPDVRILAPIPGRQAIGVEVPNTDRHVVSLGDVLTSEEARRAKQPLEVALGRDINGNNILVDLATMPHLLIAGQTGAGKSSCINSLITSVLMRTTPEEVRMILIDPKRVELGQYNRLPHLLTQVVTNPKKAANALSWAVREMERRYDLLSETGFRDIGGYNAAWDRGELTDDETSGEDGPTYTRLPLLLIVVDELNDLMMVAARDVEESICRIAQMARAVGIHLVVATQRPSVNVITGVIKANIPSRLAFAVSSLADSRVILDQPGAERLVGKGDMLLVGSSSTIAQRIQGCWVSEREVRGVVAHWRRQAPEIAFDDAAVQGPEEGSPGASAGGGTSGGDDDDDLLAQATELVVRTQLGSTSMLQRKLRVGFARAGRLMDLLEQRGIVGPSEGSKARAVLMTPEELDAGMVGTAPGADEAGADSDDAEVWPA